MTEAEYAILLEACRKAVKDTAGPMAKPPAVEAAARNLAGRLSAELVKNGLVISKPPPKSAEFKDRLARELFLAKHGMTYEEYVAGRPQEELDRIQAIRILDELANPVMVALENMRIRV